MLQSKSVLERHDPEDDVFQDTRVPWYAAYLAADVKALAERLDRIEESIGAQAPPAAGKPEQTGANAAEILEDLLSYIERFTGDPDTGPQDFIDDITARVDQALGLIPRVTFERVSPEQWRDHLAEEFGVEPRELKRTDLTKNAARGRHVAHPVAAYPDGQVIKLDHPDDIKRAYSYPTLGWSVYWRAANGEEEQIADCADKNVAELIASLLDSHDQKEMAG